MPTNQFILLISNSTLFGSGYLDHAETEIRDFLGSRKRVLFVPYALHDRDAYAANAQQRFQQMGYELTSIHTAADPITAVNNTENIVYRWWEYVPAFESPLRF